MRTSAPEKFHRLQGYRIRSTEKAILFEVHQVDGNPLTTPGVQHWFPRSQMKSSVYVHKADSGEEMDMIEVKEWIVKDKELIE